MNLEIKDIKKEKKKNLIDLGIQIKTIRKSKNITQEVLADIIGKSHTSITRLEKGKINPGYIYLLEISEGLNIKISELLDFPEDFTLLV